MTFFSIMTSRLTTRKTVSCRMSTIYNRVLFLSSSPCFLMLSQAIDNTLKTLALTSTLRVCPPLLERFGPCEDSPIPSQRKYAGMRVTGKIFSVDGTKRGPTGIAGGSPYAPVRLFYQRRPSRRIYDLTFAFLLLATRERVTRERKS